MAENFEMIGYFMAYLAATILVVSVPLMILNYLFDYLRDRRRINAAKKLMPEIGNSYKRMTMETIKEINQNLYNQFADDEEESQ